MPKEKVSFENVLKPLIDLDGESHTQLSNIIVGLLHFQYDKLEQYIL